MRKKIVYKIYFLVLFDGFFGTADVDIRQDSNVGDILSNKTCQAHSPCNNADEITQAIISDEGNNQRLLEAFYPINKAKPQFILVIFFTNGTRIDKEVCIDREPYVGIIFELNGRKNVYGTMWYASNINTITSTVVISELALLIPQSILGQYFKVNPIITYYTTVCLTIPYLTPPDGIDSDINDILLPVTLTLKGAITMNKIDSTVYSEAKGYACGIEYVENGYCYSGCIPYPNPLKSPLTINAFFGSAVLCFWPLAIAILIVKYRVREYIIAHITNGASDISTFSITWSTVLFAILFDFYLIIHFWALGFTFVKSEVGCYGSSKKLPSIGICIPFVLGMNIAIGLFLTLTAKISNPSSNLPIPRFLLVSFNILTLKCFSFNAIKKSTNKLGIWITIHTITTYVCYHVPMVLIALLSDPYRNAFIMMSFALCAACIIAFIAAVISIDQVYASDCRVAVTGKVGCRQCLAWLYIFTLFLLGATLLISIHCLLLLDITLPLSYNINFSWLFSTAITIAIPYVILSFRKVFFRSTNLDISHMQ